MDVSSKRVQVKTDIPPEVLREVETHEVRRAMGEQLLQKMLADVLGVTGIASTATSGENSGLTLHQLSEVVEKLRQMKSPLIYYRTSEAITKFGEDGKMFIVEIKLGTNEVFFFHPDWLPMIREYLGDHAWLLTEFDVRTYALEETYKAWISESS